MKEISYNYLEGIKEGRSQFNCLDKPSDECVECAAICQIKFCNDVEFLAGSEIHTDFIKGLRDFWKNQLARVSK